MTSSDRDRWNERYRQADLSNEPLVPAGFTGVAELLPTEGRALDVACGAGSGSVWLAKRGLTVVGVDGSDVAVSQAKALAAVHQVGSLCSFVTADLDEGLPSGPPVALITCHLFSAPALDQQLIERLELGGVLAIAVLSEVGGEPGPYRARNGELLDRFGTLDVRFHVEENGTATLVGVAAGPQANGRLD